MKRKKRGDPQLEKVRTEKKRRRLWREVKRLMKLEKQLKPLEEIDIPYKIIDNREYVEYSRLMFTLLSID